MSRLLMQCLFWGLLIILQWGGHECCLKEERTALLQIKAFFKINVSDDEAHHILSSWLDNGDDTDCCTWERVTCNPTTGHVTELTLHDLRRDHLPYYFTKLSLNVSLFSPFKELVNLQLNGNSFSGCVRNQGFDKLIHLKRLEALNLADNFFENNIFRSLRVVTTLKSLNLSSSWISGNVSLQDFTSFKNLKVLDLSANYFEGSIPPAIANLSTLVALSLAGNSLSGTLPSQEFCKLKNLEELDLSDNYLGVLLPCFGNLSSLRLLDLSRNQFKGEISFIFPNLRSLEYIRLGDNHFNGKFSFSLLANHSKAKIVEILDNGNLEVETDDSNWIPKFQLEVLVLSGCNLNKQSRKIPTFLEYQSMLKMLDLSHNNLRGGFPDWLIKNNSELQVLNLRNNSLEGQLHLQPHLNTSIFWIDVSDNHLNGKLQENVGKMLPQINFLNLSGNYFEGFVPSSFCNMSQSFWLDLSSNFFDGEIFKEIISGCLSNLGILILSANRFHGQIFSTHFNMTELFVLRLEDNQFSGPISNAISRSRILYFLDASNNHFSGRLYSWISNMTFLKFLFIQNNSLNGQLPCLIPSLLLLDVSHNSLSGPLPSYPFELEHVLLQSNKFTGSIPETLLNSSNLETVDIKDNDLSGNFPSVNGAENLGVLLLGGNQLSGSLPNQLCRLQKINLLDLSDNHFSSQIPRCIRNVSFGKYERNTLYFVEEFLNYMGTGLPYRSLLVKEYDMKTTNYMYDEVVRVVFVTKRRFNTYEGHILNYMSGLDLSCNNFTGEIPYELGELNSIHALNLSHNQIKGPIPKSFSGLRQLESLDLSYNNLTGKIPSELIDLTFLAVFSVAHNNLSGKIPEMKEQFGTFDQSSYEGNPYLCGAQLANNCSHIPSSPTPTSEFTSETKWYDVDMLVFWVAFIVAFIIFFLGVAISVYVSPSWHRRLFNFVDDCYYVFYYRICM